MTAAFSPPKTPSTAGSTGTTKTRSRTASFGDGYEQRGQDGLNTIARTQTWVWAALKKTDYDTIIAFFKAQGGVQPFTWTPPGEAAGKFICTEWTTTYPGGTLRAISAPFKEVFDP